MTHEKKNAIGVKEQRPDHKNFFHSNILGILGS